MDNIKFISEGPAEVLDASLPERGAQWEGLRRGSTGLYGPVRESQLRGSGGVSPRFPIIPMRYGVAVWRLLTQAAAGKGEVSG